MTSHPESPFGSSNVTEKMEPSVLRVAQRVSFTVCSIYKSRRPADVYLPCWKRGRPAALDITVISTIQKATIQSAAENQGHALLVAEERKFAAHGATCQVAGISFLPLAIETLGGLSDTTVDTISSIGRLIGQRFGISPPESSRQLFQRLAVSLWRGNATARCLPPAPNLDGVV